MFLPTFKPSWTNRPNWTKTDSVTLRVLGIDPGLTRCGVGIVDVEATRKARLVYVGVIRTPPDLELEKRLLEIGEGIAEILDQYAPQAVAIERVFAQHNLRTVMGTAQASGVALHLAAARGIPVSLHTPSEVKASVTGYGSANKKQVGTMVARILGLDSAPTPADAADALALAICAAWSRGGTSATGRTRVRSDVAADAPTPAQAAWRAAEKSATNRRLAP
jgi:crossover junction endodeoxyribonuclease RuvC